MTQDTVNQIPSETFQAEFIKDFHNACSQMDDPKKSGFNPYHKSKYSTLKDIFDAIRKPLFDNGFTIYQSPFTILQKPGDSIEKPLLLVGLETIIYHKSSEYLKNTIAIPSAGGIQDFGSIVTYLRRYSIQSMLGLTPDEENDDDGERASGRKEASRTKNASQATKTVPEQMSIPNSDSAPSSPAEIDVQALKKQWMATKALGVTDAEWKSFIKTKWNVNSSKELTPAQFEEWFHLVSAPDASKESLLGIQPVSAPVVAPPAAPPQAPAAPPPPEQQAPNSPSIPPRRRRGL